MERTRYDARASPSAPAPVDTNVVRVPRAQSVLGKSSTPAPAAPRARAPISIRPIRARTQPTPQASPQETRQPSPVLRASTTRDTAASTTTPPAQTRAQNANTSGRRAAFQGTVRVAGMRRTQTDTPPSTGGTTVGTGARVVAPSRAPSRAARSATTTRCPSRIGDGPRSASPVQLGSSPEGRGRPWAASATPNTADSDRMARVRRSPTSPTSEVRNARLSPSPPRSKQRPESRVGAAPVAPVVQRARSDVTPRAADLSGSFLEHGRSPASALGTPAGQHAHPFTPHVAHATPEVRPSNEQFDAKNERKLLDLEISNKSLLVINATLESAKLKQAKELRMLRQQIFHAQVEQASDPTEVYGLESQAVGGELAELLQTTKMQDKESLPAQVARAFAQQDEELHEMHARCRQTIDTLMEEARAAILARPDGEQSKSRVLHPSEIAHDGEEADEDGLAPLPSPRGTPDPHAAHAQDLSVD